MLQLYTSGSTGKPKGVQHTQGGYMVGAATTFKYVFDYQEKDVYWCTADCGWITGHSYVTYGEALTLEAHMNGMQAKAAVSCCAFPNATCSSSVYHLYGKPACILLDLLLPGHEVSCVNESINRIS